MLDHDLDEQPQSPLRTWLVGLVALALMAACGAVAYDLTPAPLRARLGFAPQAAAPDLPTPTPTPPGPTATPTTLPPPSRTDHYWLQRPIAPSGTDWVDYSYAYGSRGDGTMRVHRGGEFVNPVGTPALAAADGRVVYAGPDDVHVYGPRPNYYGQVVVLELDQTLDGRPVFLVYGHLASLEVATDDRVSAGDTVGLVGMTGIALGPHLHFEVRVGRNDFSATANAELWLRPYEGMGTLAGVVRGSDGELAPEVQLRVVRASQPGVPIREFTSYPVQEVNPDPAWGENMACGDLEAGQWVLQALRGGFIMSSMPFSIEAGRTTWVEMQVPW